MKHGLGPENAPTPDPQNEVPLKAIPIVPEDTTFRYRNMREALMTAITPATCEFTALATRMSGKASLDNKTGTVRAPYFMPGFDEDYQFFYLIPINYDAPGSVPVSYPNGRATFNLYVAFQAASRLAPEGRRELYPLKAAPGEVTVGEVKGWGLVCKLSEVTSEPITTLSEEEKARRKAARERNKQKKHGGSDTAATGD